MEDESMQKSQLFQISQDIQTQEKDIDENQTDNVQEYHLKAKQYKPFDPNYSFEKLSKLPNFIIKPSSNGKIYFGQVFNGLQQGKGVQLYQNARMYEGEWENNRKHGKGYEVFASKAVYEGYFVNGRPQGFGVYKWPNGEFYEGEWLSGSKHGQGKWVGRRGDMYEGEWKQGKPDGHGFHRWINGDEYEGGFKDCLKQGYGIEKFGNGDVYKGNYSNGKPEGEGEYLWKDGSIFTGKFKNGLRCGFGEYTSVRYKYKGFYDNDKKCGFGEYYYTDGKVYKGQFFNDQKNGEGQLFMPDGSILYQTWHQGKLLVDEEKNYESPTKSYMQTQRVMTSSESQKKQRLQSGRIQNSNELTFHPQSTMKSSTSNGSNVPPLFPKKIPPKIPPSQNIQIQTQSTSSKPITLQTKPSFTRQDFVIPNLQASSNTFVSNTGLKGYRRAISMHQRQDLNKTVQENKIRISPARRTTSKSPKH